MERQCPTCAYRGRFVDAPVEIQQMHGDFIAECRAEDGNDAYVGHRCHERHDACVGCARWTKEMEAPTATIQPTT